MNSKENNEENYIIIKGARVNNLKNINVAIPHNKLVVITGLSGSGKTSLAFDTLFAEGQRRYVESLSSYARQFLGRMNKPEVDSISGISPAIALEQKSTNRNPRSTVGTITEIYDFKVNDEDKFNLDIFKFLDYCKEKGLKKIVLSSNKLEDEDYMEKQFIKNELLNKILTYIGK